MDGVHQRAEEVHFICREPKRILFCSHLNGVTIEPGKVNIFMRKHRTQHESKGAWLAFPFFTTTESCKGEGFSQKE